jgi:predicted RNA-binding Zn ribbon-like protein
MQGEAHAGVRGCARGKGSVEVPCVEPRCDPVTEVHGPELEIVVVFDQHHHLCQALRGLLPWHVTIKTILQVIRMTGQDHSLVTVGYNFSPMPSQVSESSPGSGPIPGWVPEIETKPAPMPLLLVQSFVNTREEDAGTDLLSDAATARDWLNAAGILPDLPFDERGLALVRDIRESIRSLLVHNGGGPPPTGADLRPLAALARTSRFRPRVGEGGQVNVEPEDGAGLRPMGTLLLVIRDAQRDGTWSRLKACRNSECQWAFFDRSHARRGAWCDMAVCGNRIKNRNLRSRRPTTGR